jgi:hypothetical protein
MNYKIYISYVKTNNYIEKLEILNQDISHLNATTVPNFSMDLLKNTKRKQGRRSNYIYKFQDIYKDGVHPIDILAELWLRKIQKIVIARNDR